MTRVTTTSAPRLGGVATFALLAGPMLSMIDSSVVNVAMPAILTSLGATMAVGQWVASAYLLTLGVGLPLTPWLSAAVGPRRLYPAAMLAFGAASLGCALAPTMAWLIAARAVQGLVAAPMVPLAMSALVGRAGQEQRMPAAAGILLFAAPAVGPTLGGLLLGLGPWPLVFLINVPVALAATVAGRAIPASALARTSGRRRLDLVGLALLGPGLVALLWGIDRVAASGWTPATDGVLAGGAVLVIAYLAWASRRREPLVDVRHLASRTGLLALLLSAAATVIAYAAIFLVPTFLQHGQGRSAWVAGLALLPAGVVTGLGAVAGNAAAARVGVRWTVVAGLAGLAVASALLVGFGTATPLWLSMVVLAGRGLAIGLVSTPLLDALVATAPSDRRDDVNAAFNLVMRVGSSLGITALGLLFAQQSGPVAGLRAVGVVMAVAAAVAVLPALALPRRRGD